MKKAVPPSDKKGKKQVRASPLSRGGGFSPRVRALTLFDPSLLLPEH